MNFPRNNFIQLANQQGRSQDFIQKTLTYSDNLIKQNLPVVFSLDHFAHIVGIHRNDLLDTIKNRGFHYSYFLMKKKSGGYRRIIAPHKNIKFLQDWIKLNILDKLQVHSACTGFTKKKSIVDNAKQHLNSHTILNIDLENFFETVTERRVFGIFKKIGFHPNLAVEFAKICTGYLPEEEFEKLADNVKKHFEDYSNLPEPVLVQGAPTSPTLSNLACLHLDYRFTNLSNKLGINYTRYADDMTFSGDTKNLPSITLCKKIIEEENFKINWSKKGVYKKGHRQIVTGLLINGSIRIPKKFKKEIFRHLYFCKKFGPSKHFELVAPDKAYYREWLIGKILFVNSVEPEIAKLMFAKAKEIDW